MDGQYNFAFTLNPFYLRGDFNGDGKPDIAVLVRNKRSSKLGIAICHGGKNEVFLVGAGTDFGNGGDDFSWIDVWQVYRVSLKTDERNTKSRRAIERLGALLEGVRRADMPAQDGSVRSSAYYSIMRGEWPDVRKKLEDALAH